MYANFKVDISDVNGLIKELKNSYCFNIFSPKGDDKISEQFFSTLQDLVLGDKNAQGIINGKRLQNYTFPTGNIGDYDVFISHSHNDLETAQCLAQYLSKCCGLNVFLDSYIWGSADKLLKKIDEYCKIGENLYSYSLRNYTTSHVHAMLSMAILDIIYKTECCIFLESDQSVDLSSLGNSNAANTLSPWIYEELSMMRMLQRNIPKRMQTKCLSEERNNILISHPIDISDFYTLSQDDLEGLYNKGTRGLDDLYNKNNSNCNKCI